MSDWIREVKEPGAVYRVPLKHIFMSMCSKQKGLEEKCELLAEEMKLVVISNLYGFNDFLLRGFTVANAGKLEILFKFGNLKNHYQDDRPKIHSSRESYDVFHPYLAGLQVEKLAVLYMNQANKKIKVVIEASGDTAGCIFPQQQVYKRATVLGAKSIILAHNHPSNNLTPSSSDKRLTKKTKEACGYLGFQLLDHIIVGNDGYYSFADEGEL